MVDIATFMAKLKLALKIRADKMSTRIHMLVIDFYLCCSQRRATSSQLRVCHQYIRLKDYYTQIRIACRIHCFMLICQ